MERRSHRLAVLLAVVLLHVPLLFAIRDWLAPRLAQRAAAPEMIVEFLLKDAPPPPLVRRPRASTRPEPLRPRAGRNDATASAPPAAREPGPVRDDRAVAGDVNLYTADGALRIPSTLSEDIAPKVAEGPDTYHLPSGDTWVLREPSAPVEYVETRFARAFLPEGMNPVEEACWRNRGFAFIMTMLGSRDCAAPGRKDPLPTPAMIVYGVDDADDILRKTEDWARYDER